MDIFRLWIGRTSFRQDDCLFLQTIVVLLVVRVCVCVYVCGQIQKTLCMCCIQTNNQITLLLCYGKWRIHQTKFSSHQKIKGGKMHLCTYHTTIAYVHLHIRVTPTKYLDFRFLRLTQRRGVPAYVDKIFDEKMKIDFKMVERETGQFWCCWLV